MGSGFAASRRSCRSAHNAPRHGIQGNGVLLSAKVTAPHRTRCLRLIEQSQCPAPAKQPSAMASMSAKQNMALASALDRKAALASGAQTWNAAAQQSASRRIEHQVSLVSLPPVARSFVTSSEPGSAATEPARGTVMSTTMCPCGRARFRRRRSATAATRTPATNAATAMLQI